MTQRKKWGDLTITDDYMFKLIMSYKRICKHLIERILGIEVKDIAYIENEYPLKSTHESKGVRLDVFVADAAGSRFVLEMQVRNYGAREIGRRSRFYQMTIDFDFLTTGEAYKDLGDAYVIFFCPFPLWGGARRVYTFENTCREDKELTLQDGMTKVFLSSAGKPTDDIDPEVNDFLNYMNGILGDSPFIREIDEEIRKLKENGEKEELYMNFLMSINDDLIEARAEARKEGRAEGTEKTQISALKNLMKNLNLSLEKAMDALGIPSNDRAKYAAMIQN
ncbi:Rpn family recombination-promoting nuclease/putative transposase [uncultured Selenomonas sp.]|uniref:Rpn family recombination-promoting nuclease/putative transposase n=1 Tax=uncultured Selenomonas sp. TaxID=159275 RepID=UPI00258D0C63|nr:Rpn family recombination-promoting nuclease/putative transposase [uncultured Selenomonas sp.]